MGRTAPVAGAAELGAGLGPNAAGRPCVVQPRGDAIWPMVVCKLSSTLSTRSRPGLCWRRRSRRRVIARSGSHEGESFCTCVHQGHGVRGHLHSSGVLKHMPVPRRVGHSNEAL